MCHQSYDDQDRYHQHFSADEDRAKLHTDEDRTAQELRQCLQENAEKRLRYEFRTSCGENQ